MGIVFVLVGQGLQQDLTSEVSTCGVEQVPNSTYLPCRLDNTSSWTDDQFPPMDFTYPLILYVVTGFLALLCLVLLFRPTYKRLAVEGRAQEILSRLEDEDTATPASSIASLPATSRRHENRFKMNPNQKIDQSSTQL